MIKIWFVVIVLVSFVLGRYYFQLDIFFMGQEVLGLQVFRFQFLMGERCYFFDILQSYYEDQKIECGENIFSRIWNVISIFVIIMILVEILGFNDVWFVGIVCKYLYIYIYMLFLLFRSGIQYFKIL